MIELLLFFLSSALLCAMLAILLGRNLTRSVVAGFAMIAGMVFALLIARAGYFGLAVVLLGALMLAAIQLFGWMLVDVDRDHLAKMDFGTAFARSLAFAVFGLSLGFLASSLWRGGELGLDEGALHPVDAGAVGFVLFGEMGELVTMLGFAIAGALLSSILLLRDDGRGNG